MPTDVSGDWDGQDQSELFDEDNQTDEGGEMRTLEELPDVLDVTQAAGDADDDAARIGEELDDDEIIELEMDSDATDIEDDELRTRMPEAFDDDSLDIGDAEEVLYEEERGLDARDEDDARGDEAAEYSMNRARSDDVELEPSGDLNDRTGAKGDGSRFESKSVSDEELERLGYLNPDR